MISLIDLLGALVRIPSPNPPGDTRAIAAFIAATLQTAGAVVTTHAPAVKPEAISVIATIGSGDPVVMLHAHIDTVPIAVNEAKHWSVDPYAAAIQDGKLYGKGAVDDKAPLAAMMRVLIENAARNLHGTLVLVAAAEEETGGVLGTRWLADAGHLPLCDFIVVGEQTGNHIAAAHKGVVRATIQTTGRSVHATNPDRGVNAITAMAHVVLAFAAYHSELAARLHPLVGHPTCNVGVIRGGSTANAVPDSCEIFLDRRMIPDENPHVVQQEMVDIVRALQPELAPAQVEIRNFQVSDWFGSSVDSPLARAFAEVVRADGRDPAPIGYLPGSDAKHLKGALKPGGEMIIFGPGSYEVAHAYDEYVEIDALETTARTLGRFIERTMLNGAS
ncbi:MAG: ArgE/DapE family deacylase [Chloroflexota bacterium]|nr:ArgE/DapE family deacylase [Chloroflexota bacterium]